MKDKESKIIYIGKAKNLNKRVSSYFLKQYTNNWKTSQLVTKIADIEVIVTDNEIP